MNVTCNKTGKHSHLLVYIEKQKSKSQLNKCTKQKIYVL